MWPITNAVAIRAALLGLSALLSAQLRPARIGSPDGKLYAIDEPGQHVGQGEERQRLVVYTVAGKEVSIAHVWLVEPDGTRRAGIRGCETWGWIDNERLFCEGSINPSTAIYLIFDARTGKELDELDGDHFTWSPDRRYLAHYFNVPHFMDVNDKSDSFGIAGVAASYPPSDDQGKHWFRSTLVWAPDSRAVAVVDHRRSAGDFMLAIATISGDVVTYRLDWNAESEDWPPPKDFDVQWDDARVIVTHASRQQAVVVR